MTAKNMAKSAHRRVGDANKDGPCALSAGQKNAQLRGENLCRRFPRR